MPQDAPDIPPMRRPDTDPTGTGRLAQPLARDALARRKRRDIALILPLLGVFLLASPVLNIFAGSGSLYGIPASLLYVFGVWFALIACTAFLARRLRDDDRD
jgi:hypothetical protein